MIVKLRPATPDDAVDIVRLINMAGEGVATALWSGQAQYGEDPLEAGVKITRDALAPISWRNATIAEADDETAGVLVSTALSGTPENIEQVPHPFMRPLVRLRNMAPQTNCIDVMSVYPKVRQAGVGERLLDHACAHAGSNGVSTIVADNNATGIAFLQAHGFAETARLPAVRGDLNTDSNAWILMIRA